jgi:hypothetical protein
MAKRRIVVIKFETISYDLEGGLLREILQHRDEEIIIWLKYKNKVVARAAVKEIEHRVEMCLYMVVEQIVIIKKLRRDKLFQESFGPLFTTRDNYQLSFSIIYHDPFLERS